MFTNVSPPLAAFVPPVHLVLCPARPSPPSHFGTSLPVILNVDQCFQFSESFVATFFQEVRFILKNIYQDECSLR